MISNARKIYWFIFRPKTFGIRAIIINPKNQILLIEHKYAGGWYLPGGGLKKNEKEIDGLKRELKEELNLVVGTTPEFFRKYSNNQEYKQDTISVYLIKVENLVINYSNFEIKEIKFFDFDKLPTNISPGTNRRIQEYLEQKENLSSRINRAQGFTCVW